MADALQTVRDAANLLKAVDELGAQNIRMRNVLEWLDRKGSLGYEAHDRIRGALGLGDEQSSST